MNCDQTFYSVLYRTRDGRLVFAERTAVDAASLTETVRDIVNGQMSNVVSVVAFNPAEGWANDASEDVARECGRHLCNHGFAHNIRSDLRDFIEAHTELGSAIPAVAFEPAREVA